MSRKHHIAGWTWALATLLVVAGAAIVGYWKLSPVASIDRPTTTTAPAGLSADHDYYVFVKLIELRPTRPDGDRWDTGKGSAPDIYFTLAWQDSTIFTGTERNDTLIANWDLFRVDIKDTITNGGKLDIASSINAPLIHITAGGKITLEVWDDDPVNSDQAGKIEIELDTLRPGSTIIEPPETSGVRRIILELIDRNTPLEELIALQAKR